MGDLSNYKNLFDEPPYHGAGTAAGGLRTKNTSRGARLRLGLEGMKSIGAAGETCGARPAEGHAQLLTEVCVRNCWTPLESSRTPPELKGAADYGDVKGDVQPGVR